MPHFGILNAKRFITLVIGNWRLGFMKLTPGVNLLEPDELLEFLTK